MSGGKGKREHRERCGGQNWGEPNFDGKSIDKLKNPKRLLTTEIPSTTSSVTQQNSRKTLPKEILSLL